MTATVHHIDTRQEYPCPHCDATLPTMRLDIHLKFDCPVLRSRTRHPSMWTDGGGGAA